MGWRPCVPAVPIGGKTTDDCEDSEESLADWRADVLGVLVPLIILVVLMVGVYVACEMVFHPKGR